MNPVPATKAQLAEIRKLARTASHRHQTGLLCVEGPVLVAEVLDSRLRVRYVVGAESLLSQMSSGTVAFHVADPDRLCDAMGTKSPQPIVAVAEIPEPVRLESLEAGPLLALVEIGDPGNAGTMIRTAEAAGMAGVVMVGECVDSWNPKLVRASAGAALRLPIVRVSEAELFAAGRRPVVATVVGRGTHYMDTDLSAAVICLGNEAHGLSPGFIDRCDAAVTIPLAGPTESLNVAAAAAVLAFSALHQRASTSLSQQPL
ncbi:MAG: RNA methyltransferase [Acidimicrobiales bacterium]|nr:RNA methyltransferase [Acidimicrobiales bacterium]